MLAKGDMRRALGLLRNVQLQMHCMSLESHKVGSPRKVQKLLEGFLRYEVSFISSHGGITLIEVQMRAFSSLQRSKAKL